MAKDETGRYPNAKELKGMTTDKLKKISLGGYLYIFIYPSRKNKQGKKTFIFKGYRYNGKQVSEFSIGTFRYGKNDRNGDLTLAEARDKVADIIRVYRDGIDYREAQKEEKRLATLLQTNTFNHWFIRYLETKSILKASTLEPLEGRAERWIIPQYGRRAIDSIKRRELIEYLTGIGEKDGRYTTRNKVANILHGVFELALNHEVIAANPCANIIKALPKSPPAQNHPALTKSSDVAQLARDIYARKSGVVQVNMLTKFSLHVMLRPKEARSLKWSYVDFDDDIIRLPADEIKTGEYHVVPMSRQVKDFLLVLHDFTGLDDYVFSMPDNKDGYPSENAVNSALHKMGYKGKQVAHGFRTTASTQLNESGRFSKDAIEKQLAHNDKSQVRAVYNRADYVKERREMLQYWSDRIDELRAKG